MAGTLNRTCAWLAACIVALASWKGHAQTAAETQRDFAAGLVRFIDAIAGTYGDEGPHIASALKTMNAGLARWNATLETAERATDSRAQSGSSQVAAAAHLQLGGMYLERGRLENALQEFAKASRQDPHRADVHLLRGLTYERTGRFEDAAAAFRLARERDRNDPVIAYMFVRQTANIAESPDAQQAIETLRQLQRKIIEERDGRRQSPFIQIALLDAAADTDPVFPLAGRMTSRIFT